MKFAFITLEVIYGEYSTLSYHISEYGENDTLDEVSRNCALGFYPEASENGEVEEVKTDCFNFFDGGTVVEISSAREITEDEYNVLKKFIY